MAPARLSRVIVRLLGDAPGSVARICSTPARRSPTCNRPTAQGFTAPRWPPGCACSCSWPAARCFTRTAAWPASRGLQPDRREGATPVVSITRARQLGWRTTSTICSTWRPPVICLPVRRSPPLRRQLDRAVPVAPACSFLRTTGDDTSLLSLPLEGSQRHAAPTIRAMPNHIATPPFAPHHRLDVVGLELVRVQAPTRPAAASSMYWLSQALACGSPRRRSISSRGSARARHQPEQMSMTTPGAERPPAGLEPEVDALPQHARPWMPAITYTPSGPTGMPELVARALAGVGVAHRSAGSSCGIFNTAPRGVRSG